MSQVEIQRAVEHLKTKNESDIKRVLSGFLKVTSKFMGLSNKELYSIIKLNTESYQADLNSFSAKNKASLMIMKIYDDLLELSNMDNDFVKNFLRTENKHFNATPVQVMQSQNGLDQVVDYLDTKMADKKPTQEKELSKLIDDCKQSTKRANDALDKSHKTSEEYINKINDLKA